MGGDENQVRDTGMQRSHKKLKLKLFSTFKVYFWYDEFVPNIHLLVFICISWVVLFLSLLLTCSLIPTLNIYIAHSSEALTLILSAFRYVIIYRVNGLFFFETMEVGSIVFLCKPSWTTNYHQLHNVQTSEVVCRGTKRADRRAILTTRLIRSV